MPRCPSCGFEGELGSFEQLRESWRYSFYTVYRLQCPVCGSVFNYYVGVSPRGKPSSFTIRVKPRPQARK